MHANLKSSIYTIVFALGIWMGVPPTQAQMQLTLDAQGRGFSLSTYATYAPGTMGGLHPNGIGYRTDGQVLMADSNGDIYLFPDHVDGKIAGAENRVAAYGVNNAAAFAQIQSGNLFNYFMGQAALGRIIQVDRDGQFTGNVIVNGTSQIVQSVPFPSVRLVGNTPGYTGHFFVSSPTAATIWNVDPVAKTKTVFAHPTGLGPDGMAFSSDGHYLFVALNTPSKIRAYNVMAPTIFTDSPVIQSGMPPVLSHTDGVTVGVGSLDGYVYANNNDGSVWEWGAPVGPHVGELRQLAFGGSRGDISFIDPYVRGGGSIGYPSMLLSQADSVLRLSPPFDGGFFGGPTEDYLVFGDINGDGVVDLFDATALVEVLLGTPLDPSDTGRSDLNNDGRVNGLDIQPFIKALLGYY